VDWLAKGKFDGPWLIVENGFRDGAPPPQKVTGDWLRGYQPDSPTAPKSKKLAMARLP
jgi:hypothetical protein